MTPQVKNLKTRRKNRVRAKIRGTASRPRLSVFRSLKSISAQLIDDQKGITLTAAGKKDLPQAKTKLAKTEKARLIGQALAQKALKLGIKETVFDRGPYRYHGRLKALAEGAREGGLKF